MKKVKCPICLKYTSSVHDRLRPIRIKYNKVVDRKCYLILLKRRFICHRCKKKIIEDFGINSSNRTISNSLEIKIRKDLLVPNLSIQQIANENNVSHNEVREILKDVMSNYPNHVNTLPQVISLDEFAAHTSYGKYALIINEPIKKRTLDILPSRRKDYLMSYFTKVENRGNVKCVIGDMYDTYLIVTKAMFKNAKYVVDRFHFIRYIMAALDDIRIRLQDKYGYNSREYKLLKNKKNVSLLRKRYIDINWYVYVKRYKKGRYVYKLPKNILNEILAINIEASKTIKNWLPYIVNSFIDKRYSNAYTEGLNNKIKIIKRNAYGYKNFDFFRLRLLYILNGKLSGRSKKMVNKEELLYKLEVIIKYLKDNKGYEYKLYNRVCPDNNIEPDSNIVEYAEDVKNIVKKIIKILENIEN